jgi:hypothetical protein
LGEIFTNVYFSNPAPVRNIRETEEFWRFSWIVGNLSNEVRQFTAPKDATAPNAL